MENGGYKSWKRSNGACGEITVAGLVSGFCENFADDLAIV